MMSTNLSVLWSIFIYALLFISSISAQNDISAINTVYTLGGVTETDMIKITQNINAAISNFTEILTDGLVNHLVQSAGVWELTPAQVAVELQELNGVSASQLKITANPKTDLETGSGCSTYPCTLTITSEIICTLDTANYINSSYDKDKLKDKLLAEFELYFGNSQMEFTVNTFEIEPPTTPAPTVSDIDFEAEIDTVYTLGGVTETDMLKITRNMDVTVSNFTAILTDGLVNHLPQVVGGWKLVPEQIAIVLEELNDVSISKLKITSNPKIELETGSGCSTYPCKLTITSDIKCTQDTANYIDSRYDKEKLADKLWALFEMYFQNSKMELTVDTFEAPTDPDAPIVNPAEEEWDSNYTLFIVIIVMLIMVLIATVVCYQYRLGKEDMRKRLQSVALDDRVDWTTLYQIVEDEQGEKQYEQVKMGVDGKPILHGQTKAIKPGKKAGTSAAG